MKKFTLLVLTIFIFSCSQKELSFENLVERNNLTYEINNENPFSGKAFSKYENQQFKEIGFFEDGKKVGIWEYYSDNGQIVKKTTYENNELNGLYEEFTLAGKKIITTEYKDNFKDGLSEEYNDKEIKISSINFTKDSLNGSYKTYYQDGDKVVINQEGNYKMNKKDGSWLKNHGSYKENLNYLNDKLNGKYSEVDKDGTITRNGSYKNGNKDGVWTKYYSKNVKQNESKYENKTLKSKKEWNSNNKLTFSAEYPGKSIWYDNNGGKKAEAYYRQEGYVTESTIKIWLNGKIFDYNILKKYRWEWSGKGKKTYNGYGQFYHHFNNYSGKDMYRLELLTNDRWTSTYNLGEFKIDPYRLPKLVISSNPTKSSYQYMTFEIKSWNGKKLKVNNDTWIARAKKD